MISKTVPAKTSTDKSTDDDSKTTIKKFTCKNLQGKATIGYHIGIDDTSALYWKIHSNSGAGMFSNEWVAFKDIQKALTDWDKDLPITSMTLRPLFLGKSVNTPSFLLATLVKEGILEPVPDKKRHYQLGDPAAFLAAVEAQHSGAGKGKPKAKAKAGARMSKPPAGK